MQLSTIIEQYLSHLARSNYAQNTVRVYRSDFRQFLAHAGGELAALDRHTIRAWLAVLWRAELSPRTIRNKLAALTGLLDWCVAERHIPRNPARSIARPKLPHTLPRVPSERQINALIDRLAEDGRGRFHFRDLLIFELLYGTGMRCAELTTLDLGHIDQADRWLLVHGKGRRQRWVPYGRRAAEALDGYLSSRHARPGEPALLTSCRATRISTSAVHGLVKAHGAREGLDLYPHLLRHACATHLLDRGMDLRYIQELLGHVSVRSTQFYTHLAMGKVIDVYRRAHPRA